MTDGTGGLPGGGEPEVSDSLKTFGEVFKAFRKRAGLTQEEFAELVPYSVQTWTRSGRCGVRHGICHGSRGWPVGSGSGQSSKRRR